MKKTALFAGWLLIAAITVCPQRSDSSKLAGPYLGQKPPGETPELFARDIISPICELHGGPVFTPDLKEIYWAPLRNEKCRKSDADEILFMKEIDGRWTGPRIISFSSALFDSDDPCLSPDGRRIYFTTHRPAGFMNFNFEEKIMYVERKEDGWSSPKSVGQAVNSMFRHWQVSVNRNYDVYFCAERKVDKPGLYVSRHVDGRYQSPERLPDEINSGNSAFPCIAPDDSYIIFARELKDTAWDLFVSFKDSHGRWTEARSLGDGINSPYNDLCPNLTPDGRYLFFLSQRQGGSYAFWVSAKIIEKMRPTE